MAEIVIRPAFWHNRATNNRIARSKEAGDATGQTSASLRRSEVLHLHIFGSGVHSKAFKGYRKDYSPLQ